jgi:hypothetical protein
MTERIETPASSFDVPETTGQELGRHLDALDALDAPDVQLPPDAEFLAWHEAQGDAGPQRHERPGDRLPWTEHPANERFEDYDWHPDLEREVQDTYAEHGFDAVTVQRINAIREVKGTANCGECARSVASTLDGCPRAAAAINERSAGESHTDMEAWADRPFGPDLPVDPGLDAIDRDLARRGDGAHGIVAGAREYGTGHFVNIARIDGRSVVIDAQSGGVLLPLDQGGRQYLHEQQITSVRWMPLERSHRDA